MDAECSGSRHGKGVEELQDGPGRQVLQLLGGRPCRSGLRQARLQAGLQGGQEIGVVGSYFIDIN